jgi:hypothetical protein
MTPVSERAKPTRYTAEAEWGKNEPEKLFYCEIDAHTHASASFYAGFCCINSAART